MYKKFAAVMLASILVAPLAAVAQDEPSYAQQSAEAAGVERIQGRIISFDGGYNLQVRDERGFMDRVQIHQGTIINPTGITLAPGMVVSIIGENDGDYFSGDEIDTPYTIYGGVPYYQSHAWNYYGTGLALGLYFGSQDWWHGSYFSGYHYGWSHGYRYYAIPNYHRGIWDRPGSWVGHHSGAWDHGYGYGGHPAVYNHTVNVYHNDVYNRGYGYGAHPAVYNHNVNVYHNNVYNRGYGYGYGAHPAVYNHNVNVYHNNVYNRGSHERTFGSMRGNSQPEHAYGGHEGDFWGGHEGHGGGRDHEHR